MAEDFIEIPQKIFVYKWIDNRDNDVSTFIFVLYLANDGQR